MNIRRLAAWALVVLFSGGTAQWRHRLSGGTCSLLSGGTGSVAALAQWRHWHWSLAVLAQWQHCLSDGTGSGLPDHDVEAEIVGCGAPLHPVMIEDDNPRDETWGDEKKLHKTT